MSNNKQTMTLYTEEQLRNAIAMGFVWCHQKHIPSDDMIDTFIKQLTPIELPSDEEIKKYTPYPLGKGFYNPLYSNKWEEGAKWMRDKIQGGNK